MASAKVKKVAKKVRTRQKAAGRTGGLATKAGSKAKARGIIQKRKSTASAAPAKPAKADKGKAEARQVRKVAKKVKARGGASEGSSHPNRTAQAKARGIIAKRKKK